MLGEIPRRYALVADLGAMAGRQGHDALHASDIGMDRASDVQILDRARQGAWTIITADLDYSRLLATARAREPSLILFRGGNWKEAEVVARMEGLLETMSGVDIQQSILVVDRERVRRRRLPIGE